MDAWNNLRLEMEKALEQRNLVTALSHLDALRTSASSPLSVANLLKNHRVKIHPTLHYLAYATYLEMDIPHLDKLIRIFTESGYDINKTGQLRIPRPCSNGKTALLASVKQQNVILLECLLRCGARADIRDPQGLSPCHWAIKKGNLKCLQTLLEHGGAALVTSALLDKTSRQANLHSILQEALKNGHLDIVCYLMTKEELGVDFKVRFLFKTVEGWLSFKLKVQKALEMGNLEEALYNLHAFIVSASHAVLPKLLSNHTVQDLPTLHFLARFTFQEEDVARLDKLIKILTKFDYDINKTTGEVSNLADVDRQGTTALLASVEQRNLILMECLLQHGARMDIRDHRGFSAYHLAVMLGYRNCLKKLVQLGNYSLASTPFERSGKMEVRPLLHTAIDHGRIEMVRYLLSKEELGVDVNEEAIYKTLEPDDDPSSQEKCSRHFTPLGRALLKGNTRIIEVLVNHPGAKSSRFKELHYFLKHGDTEQALSLLKYFSDEELSTDKIEDRWSLHCIHSAAFSEEHLVKYTKKLILEYVRRGWDANSVSTSTMYYTVRLFDDDSKRVAVDQYNLLHLGCFNKAPEIIKVLVEDARVNLNCKTEGDVELTPLQVLLLNKEWESAAYLIEKGADLNLRGCLDDIRFTCLMRKDLITGNLEPDSTFNSVELLVRMGYDDGLPILDKMLARPEVKLHGGNEFHIAIEERNPAYCLKVLQHSIKIISKEDLNWMTLWQWNNEKPQVKISSLISLLFGFKGQHERNPVQDNLALVDLIKLMAELGCDLNISRYKATILDYPTTFDVNNFHEPLIFYILRYDLIHRTSNLLLRTVLQFDHLQLNVFNEKRENPVEYLLREWNHRCSPRGSDSKRQPHKIVEAIQLLVTHGLDVSGMVINWQFCYHNCSMVVLKTLYRAGALILSQFFTSTYACKQFSGNLRKEKKELKKWKDEFDHGTGMSLQHMCIFQVRKGLKCVGDLKMLDKLQKSLKDTVLCTSEESTVSREVSKCEQGFDSKESREDDDIYEEADDEDSENEEDYRDYYGPDFYSD